MMNRLLVSMALVGVLACGAPPRSPLPAPPPPPPSESQGPDVAALVREADRALEATLRPDYRRPMEQPLHDLVWVSDRYLEACQAGDRPSCWVAAEIHPSRHARPSSPAIMMLRRNCRAGDQMSCRALPLDQHKEPDRSIPGWAGRAYECEERSCRDALRQECAAGLAISCRVLLAPAEATRSPEERAPTVSLMAEGCRAGLLDECGWLVILSADLAHHRLASAQHCRFAARCVGMTMAPLGGPLERRNAYERTCQYGSGIDQENACMELAFGYHMGRYPEPVPGRGRALAVWNCRDATALACEPSFLDPPSGTAARSGNAAP